MPNIGKLTLFCTCYLCVSICQGKSIDHIWIYTEILSGFLDLRSDREASISAGIDLVPYGVDLKGKTSLIFAVRCCQDAIITLIGRSGTLDFQIIIGSTDNSGVHIFYIEKYNIKSDGRDISGEILNCDNFRTFWYSWENLHFRLGRGNVTYDHQIYSKQLEFNGFTGFEHITIYTSVGMDGTWIIQNSANPGGRFCGRNGFKAVMRLRKKLHAGSSLECGFYCHINEDCLGFNFNAKTMECELVDGNQLIKKIANEQWKFIGKCLQGKDACIQCLHVS